VPGTVCLYGFNMSFPIDISAYCAGMVGYSGPQLMYRGHPLGAYEEPSVQAGVRQARKDFDSCHYFTHSPWYTAFLFLNEQVLYHDGTTDGGCKVVKPNPLKLVDALTCPFTHSLEADCAPLPDTSQSMPIAEMMLVSGSLAGSILGGLVVIYCLLQHFRNDGWVFGHDRKEGMKHKENPFLKVFKIFGYGKEGRKAKKKGVDRAKKARERDQKARINRERRARGSLTGAKPKKQKLGRAETEVDFDHNEEFANNYATEHGDEEEGAGGGEGERVPLASAGASNGNMEPIDEDGKFDAHDVKADMIRQANAKKHAHAEHDREKKEKKDKKDKKEKRKNELAEEDPDLWV